MLIDGIDGTVASSPAVKIGVTKSATSEWSLFLDQSDIGNTYQLQGLATGSKYGTSSYLGVYVIVPQPGQTSFSLMTL